jgi:hypothetical protein
LKGPERFFYDKSSYTGTHARGGPDHVPKGAGTSFGMEWKGPAFGAEDIDWSTAVDLRHQGCPRDLHSYDEEDVSAAAVEVAPTLLSGRVTPRGFVPTKPSSRGPVSTRPNACGTVGRPSSRGAGGGRMVGPERFFYDKSSYTGTHANGGPSSVAKGGGTSFDQSWKRVT